MNEVNSGKYAENQSKPTNSILGVLSSIYLLIKNWLPSLINGKIPVDISGSSNSGGSSFPTNLATETTLQQVRDVIKAQIDIATGELDFEAARTTTWSIPTEFTQG